MHTDIIKARLNLYAVLQNLEDLVRLDDEMGAAAKGWDVSIQFIVRNGPSAFLEFKQGACRHGVGSHPNPDIKLFFLSPGHLNRMFDGSGMPIPLKGFTRLGFLKGDFSRLTDRLTWYLKPDPARAETPDFLRINTELTLYTAVHAVRELALLDPTCKKVAASIPNGTLQVGVLPDGPHVHITFSNGTITVGKGVAERPSATMTFSNVQAASDILRGRLDPFQAIGQGDVLLWGLIPIIDNVNLILDRVEGYLG